MIPGSFDTMWGVGVWSHESIDLIDHLLWIIGRLFRTCRDRTSFKSQDEWRVRSRACTESMALFVFVMDADIAGIKNLGRLLSDTGSDGRTPSGKPLIYFVLFCTFIAFFK